MPDPTVETIVLQTPLPEVTPKLVIYLPLLIHFIFYRCCNQTMFSLSRRCQILLLHSNPLSPLLQHIPLHTHHLQSLEESERQPDCNPQQAQQVPIVIKKVKLEISLQLVKFAKLKFFADKRSIGYYLKNVLR